jgi:hypothetical protein
MLGGFAISRTNSFGRQTENFEQRGQELGLMMKSRKILNDTWRAVQKKASKVLPDIDVLATADHDAVSFAMKQTVAGDIPSPPVNWGRLSGKEFREKVIKDHGFDPGTW